MLHPAAMGAIALLVLNDHLLKEAAPSWLTGKLSDFTGLFFFPFMVSVGLALLLSLWPRTSPTVIGRASLVITALWFAAAKATFLGNSLTAGAVSGLLGYPVSIVLDPTDLVALVVLWPAWRLWRQEESAVRSGRVAGRAAWLVLMVAAIASMGTSPAPIEGVVLFTSDESELYALTRSGHGSWPSILSSGETKIYSTPDNGQTWVSSKLSPELAGDTPAGPLARDVVWTDPVRRLQYRRGHGETVELSEDDGLSWRVVLGYQTTGSGWR